MNDLIFDCPYQDDETELFNVGKEKFVHCAEQNMLECLPGHSKCYREEEKCRYNLTSHTKTLMYCRNGQHLQGCKLKDCKVRDSFWIFKCPDSYCIPYSFICNGRWDCWTGQDELTCTNYTCIDMYKCKLVAMCIHTNNVCDGMIACPYRDDELNCEQMQCIANCQCLNYGISCVNQSLMDELKLFVKLTQFTFVFLSNSKIQDNQVYSSKKTEILLSNHNNLSQPFLCSSESSKIVLLNLSCNIIKALEFKHFSCLLQLVYVSLSHNKLSHIEESAINHLVELQTLYLQVNELICLEKRAFSDLKKLKLLNLLGNSIVHVGDDVFTDSDIGLILSDDFHVCCVSSPSTICTARPEWPSSCEALLSHAGLQFSAWCVGVLTTLLNILSISKAAVTLYNTETRKDYNRTVMLINACDLLFGLYLLTIAIVDLILGDQYVKSDTKWRSSVLCHTLAFGSVWSLATEALWIMKISVTRYLVVLHPFDRPFGKVSKALFFVILPCLYALIISIVFFARQYLETLVFLSSPLCVLVGETEKSFSQQGITITISVYYIVVLLITFIYYSKLLSLGKANTILSETEKRERQKGVTRNVVLAGSTNAICWIPNSVFYLVSVFVDQFPIDLLYWMTLVVLPLNAMANPIIFNLSDIKAKLTKNQDKQSKTVTLPS